MTLSKLAFSCMAFAFLVAAACPCLAQEKTKLAEGEYAITNGKPGNIGKALDHWVLWKLKDQNLQVESRLDMPAGKAVQEFLFTPDLKPIGYSVSLYTKGGPGEKDQRLFLSCQLLPKLIKCKEEMRGQEEDNDAFELSVKESPYAFLPGKFYALDFSWFFVELIQNQRGDIERPVYALAETDSGKGKIELDETEKIHWIGGETVTVMGKSVPANKYELKDTFRMWTVASNGMVLVVEPTDGEGRWELTKFKSYSSTFMPELQ
jgi:hypothetical protein